MKEEEFRQQVRKIARMYGWTLMYHTHSSIRSDPGFPDEVFLNPARKRMIFIEFKSEKGRIRPAQKEWIEALQLCGQEAAIWRPSDLETIKRVLGKEQLSLLEGDLPEVKDEICSCATRGWVPQSGPCDVHGEPETEAWMFSYELGVGVKYN